MLSVWAWTTFIINKVSIREISLAFKINKYKDTKKGETINERNKKITKIQADKKRREKTKSKYQKIGKINLKKKVNPTSQSSLYIVREYIYLTIYL